MLEGPLVFVDIDTQRDFLEPAGALFIAGSGAIIANLGRLTQFALGHQVPILATACCHEPDDPELKRFPAHCMRGSSGEKRVGATAVAGSVVLAVGERLMGEVPLHLTVQKREIDVFSRPDAAESLCPLQPRSAHLRGLRSGDGLLRERGRHGAFELELPGRDRCRCDPGHRCGDRTSRVDRAGESGCFFDDNRRRLSPSGALTGQKTARPSDPFPPLAKGGQGGVLKI